MTLKLSSDLLLRIVVLKKLIVAGLLLLTSLGASLASNHFGALDELAAQWGESDRLLLRTLAERAAAAGPQRLQVLALASGIYGLLIVVAAVATWQRRLWGEVLFALLLLLTLPLELRKLAHHPELSHWLVLLLTLGGLAVVLHGLRRHRRPCD
jgi:uncharacterized membrane protein (DUF2068 family)